MSATPDPSSDGSSSVAPAPDRHSPSVDGPMPAGRFWLGEAEARRFGPAILLAVGVLLYLPRLGSFGLWDPSEVRVADVARTFLDSNGAQTGRSAIFNTWLIAEGFRRLGVGELGGRLPLALVSILALLATYWAGRSVLRARAALLGSLALATMPGFLFGARQLTSNAPLSLCVALSVGGLARLMWAPSAEGMGSRALALLAAMFGLAGGTFAAGAMHGVIAPLFAVGLALVASPHHRGRGFVLFVAGLGVAAAVAMVVIHPGQYSPLLGGVARAPQFQTVVTSVARAIGFAALPWLALAPLAILEALGGTQPVIAGDDVQRAAFARALLPAWLAMTYLGATAHDALVADLLPATGPVLGLLAGAYLDAMMDSFDARPLEGVAIAVVAIILGHDMLTTTDAFVSVHATDLIRWPVQIYSASNWLFAIIALFGGVALIGLALPSGPRSLDGRRFALAGLFAVQLVFSLAIAQWLTPLATKHLSPKDLYGKTKSLDPKAPLGQYRFNATGASYFMGGRTAKVLNTYDDVLNFLRQPERVFIFVGSEELAGIDQATRAGAEPVPYVVIDDSNSRFLIFSNRLGPNERDLNPLRKFVSTSSPTPQHAMSVNFDDKLQLLGYDLPTESRRGEDVKVRLHFKVLAPVGGAYKIFLHFDGPSARVNGDHVPLDGRFPTQFWTAGTYVTDEYVLKPERATQPAGTYNLFFGMFTGDHRLKVKDAAGSDGENRVRLGSVRVN